MEDLVRRQCGRRDAQGNAHTLAEDIRTSSLEALWPDDLQKHVQLDRARSTSYGVLREESKGMHGKGKGKGTQGQHGQDKDKTKDKNKDLVECWNCGKRGHYSKDCWNKKNTNKGGSKGKHKPNTADAHNLDSTPTNVEPEVETGGFNMFYLDAHAVEVRGSEWIKIGFDTGAGKDGMAAEYLVREDDSWQQ